MLVIFCPLSVPAQECEAASIVVPFAALGSTAPGNLALQCGATKFAAVGGNLTYLVPGSRPN